MSLHSTYVNSHVIDYLLLTNSCSFTAYIWHFATNVSGLKRVLVLVSIIIPIEVPVSFQAVTKVTDRLD